ncbi:MAG: translation elongation factor Ts [Robiginitomaculum sp.]|nr:translation elongation factor Ts [Robiginitomaculum sp.]MDQ7078487.1 translation elongation factor Ts [Robiginitomaculum sp.]
MAEITAALVRELREATSAGMMDCKKALMETGGDIDAAIDWMRKNGMSKAAKKAGRVASEGVVAVATKDTSGAMIELNSETDFVSRNADFQAFAKTLADLAVANGGDVDAILASETSSGENMSTALTSLIAKIGENMSFRRAVSLSVENGVVARYVHNAVAPDLGRIGVLVALESTGDAEKLNDLGRKIAMHVAATSPLALSVDDLDPAVVAKEREVFSEQARASGKPENIIEKMVEGRLRKFYQEVVLLNQAFVMNPDQTVAQLVEAAAEEMGTPISLSSYSRMGLGEGIEKKAEDFAAEVAAVAGSS